MNYRILPPDEMIDATIELPLSKSVTNRQLIINALTPGAGPLPEGMIARCDDTDAVVAALGRLPEMKPGERVDVGAAGTAFRFLTAFFAVSEGVDVSIDGTERLRRRPIKPLVDALRQLGAEIEYAAEEGFAPLRIKGHRLKGGALQIDGSVSSQFISALMMIGPTMESGLRLELNGEVVSRSYITLTTKLMARAGATVEIDRDEITIEGKPYSEAMPYAERDWSAASYWYELTAISAGFVTLPGLDSESGQGDRAVSEFFTRLGVTTEEAEDVENALQLAASPDQHSRFEQDLSDNPDLAPTLAVTAAMLGIHFHLRGLSTLRHKETDRLEALRRELDKFGFIIEIRGDSEMVWNGERHPVFAMPEIDTYDDHRMAMAFAPAAVLVPGLVINDIEVVTKSYPEYWDDLRSAGFVLTDASVELPDAEGDGDDFSGLNQNDSSQANVLSKF